MQRFSLPALEYHVAHGCNLSCQQCSHYSNFHLAGKLPTLADAESEYLQWSHRLKPTRFRIAWREPLLNPAILEHIQLARQHWYDSELMLVTNGFFLHRFSELPKVLVAAECQLEISQHGTHQDYLERFREVKTILWTWRNQYPKLCINIRNRTRLDASIQHRRWQADAFQFRARCSISRLYAANLHPACEWLPRKMSRTRILATARDKSPPRINFGVGFVP